MQTLRQFVRRGGRIILLCLFPVCCLNVLFLWCAGYFIVMIFFFFAKRRSTFLSSEQTFAIPLPRFRHQQGQSFAMACRAHITTTAHRVRDCCHTTQRSSHHGRMTHHSRIISAHYVRITASLNATCQADTTHADKSRSSLLTTPKQVFSL